LPINFFDPAYRVIHLPLVFVLGACFGSFFNVCIYRIPRAMALSFPGSHCYRCGRPVRWYDNVPLLSYWILRGHCRECGARFSIRYFVVELLTALLFVLCFVQTSRTNYSLAFFSGVLLIGLLMIATFTDLDHWIIPDRISLGGLAGGVLLAALWSLLLWRGMSPSLLAGNPLLSELGPVPAALLPLANALAGAALGFGVMWGIGALGALIFRKEAMGWGDIKLFAMFGAFCGMEELLTILILACVFGTLAGVLGIVLAKRAARRAVAAAVAPLAPDAARAGELAALYPLGRDERLVIARALTQPGTVGPVRHHLPFGPSLALAAVIVYLFGAQINHWFLTLMLGAGGMGGY